MGIFAAFILVVGMLLLVPASTRAATLSVCDSGCDHTTIQAAIDAASADDLITVGAGTYAEQITVDKALTITGSGSAVAQGDGTPTVISTATGPIVTVSADVTINDLDISGGMTTGNGAGILNTGILTLNNVGVSGNMATSAGSFGGGIH